MAAPDKLERMAEMQRDEHVGLDGVWRVLRRHLLLMLVIIAVVVGIAFLIVSRLEPQYKARSTLVLTLFDTRVSTTSVQIESFELTKAVIETELDILRSRGFSIEVAESLSLFDDPSFVGFEESEGLETEEAYRERVIDKLQTSYSVFRQGESLAIGIIATGSDPVLAANIANSVAETYILRSMNKRTAKISLSIGFLQHRVEGLGEKLSQSELQLAAFIAENDMDDETLRERLRSAVDRLELIAEVVRNDDSASSDEVEGIETQLAKAEALLHARTRSELTLMRMERSMELLKARYNSSIEKLNELENHLESVGQAARQVSFARPPANPYWPNPRSAVAISAVVGFALAFIVALLLEGLNKRVWSEDQIARVTGLANVGFLLRIGKFGQLRRPHDPLVYLKENPRSAYAESLRSFLTLWFNQGSKGKFLMVASGLPNEGKSTVAVSIAAAAAKDEMRVLVLDLDGHRQGSSRLLGSKRRPASLENAISGKVVPQQCTLQGLQMERVFLMSVNTRAKLPPEALKRALVQLKKKLSKDFDLILVDTSPVLIVNDVCRLGPLADDTLLVVRWGQTTEAVLRDAKETLERNGVSVTATLINDVNPNKHRNYGYGGYVHYYSYGKYDYS